MNMNKKSCKRDRPTKSFQDRKLSFTEEVLHSYNVTIKKNLESNLLTRNEKVLQTSGMLVTY